MQDLHIPIGMPQWRGVCSYRGDQTLVQGRLKVRTGETRGRLREGLRERVSEVEMFAGCLKEDGIEFVTSVLGLRMKSFCVHVMACMVLLVFAGCVQMDLSSAADCDENSKIQFCDVTSAYWWDWGESAQNILDDRLQGADGRVDERAIQRLVVSQKWWEVLATWGLLGIAKPVELTIWLEEAK